MKTIVALTIKSALRDQYLLFWSLIMPLGGTIGLSLYIQTPNYTEYILTGMICTSVFFYALMTTTFAILGQRKRGIYNLLHITPMPLKKYIVSVSCGWSLISLFCSLIIIAISILFLDVEFSIFSIILSIPLILVASLGYVFLSFFLSSFCKNEGQASMFANIIMMPFLLCSNAFYSLESAPEFVGIISKFNPFEYFVVGVRGALNLDYTAYFTSFIVLTIFFFITLAISIKTFKYS